MKNHQNKPRSMRAALAVAALVTGVLSSAVIGGAPATASEVAAIPITLDCHFEGDIMVTADPGDLLVFTYTPRTETCPVEVGGVFYVNDWNDVEFQQTKGGFLGEMGTYTDGVYADYSQDEETLNYWWGIDQGASIAAPLRELGGAILENGSYLPAAEPLVAGVSVIGVLETNWTLKRLNRFIWAGPRTVIPVEADMGLALEVGSQVAGSPVTFSGSGLRPGSDWEVAVHSTPTVIASGIVGDDGTYSSTASMPEGLEAGVHSIIATTVNADGTTATNTIVLAIGEDGALLYKSEPIANADSDAIAEAGAAAEAAVVVAAAEAAASAGASVSVLAKTGTNGSVSASLAGGALMLLLAGATLTIRRRHAETAAP